ncbi:MAG: J domain-containing protein [Actinomycetia bacterium]|nr:J domain-containing protein [Actinomycetes bacterium]
MVAHSLLAETAMGRFGERTVSDGRELAMRRARAASGKGAAADPVFAPSEPTTEFEREFSTDSLFTWGKAEVGVIDPLDEAYVLLGVDRHTPWTEITAIYKQLAREHHPDLGGNTAFMARVTEAHALIRFAHGEH